MRLRVISVGALFMGRIGPHLSAVTKIVCFSLYSINFIPFVLSV